MLGTLKSITFNDGSVFTTLPAVDTQALVKDPSDPTKLVRIDVGAIATGTTRTIIMPNADVDLSSIGGLADVVDDTTPQLGGSLDVNGQKIVSVSNGNIDIEPNGTGNVLLGNFTFDADQTVGAGQDNYVLTYDHSSGVISLEAAASGGLADVVDDTTPQLGGNLDVNLYAIVSQGGNDIEITPDTSGSIVLDGLSWPQADGTSGQVIKTDGAGQLSWVTVSGGASSLGDLSDVQDSLSGSQGDLLYFDGSNWNRLAVSATDGHVLTADGIGSLGWEAPASGVSTLGDLTDVQDSLSGNLGDILYHGGTDWTVLSSSGASDGDVLTIQSDGSLAYEPPPGAGSGEANTASNVGASGVGVFDSKVSLDLQFNKIAGGTGLTVGLASNVITVSQTALTADRALISDGSGNYAVSAVTATELGYLDGVTSAIQTQLDAKAASSHNHAASEITSGTLAHERGGLEADISAIAIGDILAGTGTGTIGIVSASAASDGDVLTIQADGSVAFETPAGGSSAEVADDVYAWDVTKATYDSKTLAVGAQESSARSIAFRSNGLAMYLVGDFNDTIYQYTLTTPWDVSTGSYASLSKTVSAQENAPYGLAFSDDGTKCYIVGTTNKTIYQYTLSTAWNVSTASYASLSKSVSAQDSFPSCLRFNNDGTKCYVLGRTNDTIYQYNLGTAWDISTATTGGSKSVSSQESAPTGFSLSADGAKLFVVGTAADTVFQYSLSTAWTISTASYYSQSFSVSAQSTSPSDVVVANGGKSMFLLGTGVQQYSLLATPLVADTTPQLGADLDVNGNALVSVSNGDIELTPHGTGAVLISGRITQAIATLTDGATVTVDFADGNQGKVTIAGNRTIAFSNAVEGQSYRLRIQQDGTGSRTVTWPSSGVTINWPGGTEPTLATTGGHADVIVLTCIDDTPSAEVYDAAHAMADLS